MATISKSKRDNSKWRGGRRGNKSRSAPSLSDKELTPLESRRSVGSYNYCSKDFPPLASESDPEHECDSPKSESSSMGPVVDLSPEVRSIPEEDGSRSSEGTSVCGSGSPPPNQRLKERATVFRSNGMVERLPTNVLNDQYGLAAFIVGQLQRFTDHAPLPDQISEEVMKEGGERDYSNSYFHKPTVPKVVSEDPPEPLPVFDVFPHMSKGMFGAGPGNDPIAQIRNAWFLKARMFSEDLLFYLFYTFAQDILQVIAAQHLFNKGWRYHVGEQVWIQPIVNAIYIKVLENSVETGLYKLFDPKLWKVIEREICVELSQIEAPPCSINPGLASII